MAVDGDHVRLPSLTSTRMFAALLVALHHTRGTWQHFPLVKWLGQMGWLGVTYFFILSGFVLMWNFKEGEAKKTFILRRIIRIYPLHLVTLLLAIVGYFVWHQPLAGYVGTPQSTLANLLLVQNWLPGHVEVRHAWNGPAWSLSSEFFFYLIAPFLFSWMLKKSWLDQKLDILLWGWACLLCFCLLALVMHWSVMLDFMDYSPLICLFDFILGACGVLLWKSGWRFRSGGLAFLAMTAPIVIYSLLTPDTDEYRRNPFMIYLFIPGAFLMMMAMVAHDVEGRKNWLHHPVLILLGEASFALYMIHALWLGVFFNIKEVLFPVVNTNPVWGDVATLGYLTTAVLLSVAVYVGLERPVRSWLMRRLIRE